MTTAFSMCSNAVEHRSFGKRCVIQCFSDFERTKPMAAPAALSLSKLAPTFVGTRSEEVFGILPYSGKPKTIAEMDEGVLAEAKRGHARD
jgi:hypothetical protein